MPVLEQVKTKLKTINLTNSLHEIEREIAEINNYQWRWSYKSFDKLVPEIQKFIDGLDWWLLDSLAINTKAYWCGFLTLEPWCVLEEEEQTMLNDLTHNHLKVVHEDGDILIRFTPNPNSLCHPIFDEYWEEWDGNIIPSFNAMMRRLETYVRDLFESKVPEGSILYNRWGQWEQSLFCENCEEHHWLGVSNYKCSQCQTPYPTSD